MCSCLRMHRDFCVVFRFWYLDICAFVCMLLLGYYVQRPAYAPAYAHMHVMLVCINLCGMMCFLVFRHLCAYIYIYIYIYTHTHTHAFVCMKVPEGNAAYSYIYICI
jgi:hypothetical protein